MRYMVNHIFWQYIFLQLITTTCHYHIQLHIITWHNLCVPNNNNNNNIITIVHFKWYYILTSDIIKSCHMAKFMHIQFYFYFFSYDCWFQMFIYCDTWHNWKLAYELNFRGKNKNMYLYIYKTKLKIALIYLLR
jgi:hypothetical protein